MGGPADEIHDGAGTFSTVAFLLCALAFLVAFWVAVGWAVL